MTQLNPFSLVGLLSTKYETRSWDRYIAVLWELWLCLFNTLRPGQNGRHFADDIFKCTFLNENVWIPIKISLKFVPEGPINIIPALVQIMTWRRPGVKPLSESLMVRLPTHIWSLGLNELTATNDVNYNPDDCINSGLSVKVDHHFNSTIFCCMI